MAVDNMARPLSLIYADKAAEVEQQFLATEELLLMMIEMQVQIQVLELQVMMLQGGGVGV